MRDGDWLRLEGRRAVVVGAGGLGGAAAVTLARLGARVLLVDLDVDHLESVRLAAKESGDDIDTLAADLGTPDACRAVVAEVLERLTGIDVFLHAVGVNVRLPVLELEDGTWDDVLRTNLSTAYWLGQAVGRVMCTAGCGRMVFMSSVSGLLAHADHAAYAATKGGLTS